jgi:hypothetical protein
MIQVCIEVVQRYTLDMNKQELISGNVKSVIIGSQPLKS